MGPAGKTARSLRASWGVPFIGVFMTSAVAAQTLPLSGTISYLGTQGPVSATRPIGVLLFNQPMGSAQNKPLASATVPTSPGNQLTPPGTALAVSTGTDTDRLTGRHAAHMHVLTAATPKWRRVEQERFGRNSLVFSVRWPSTSACIGDAGTGE